MPKLLYASNMSLDGFTEDAHGAFDWAPPDDDVFVSITEVMRSAGTYLYGRRMYETMAVWETEPSLAARSPLTAAYARVWKAARKVVHSTTLTALSTADTTLVDRFDPEAVLTMKRAADRDLLVGGPHLAAQALAARLVDEVVLYVWPIVLGGRNPALPREVCLDLDLVDAHRFANGVVRLQYRVG
jgi:dihydrofolate reductase